MSRLARRFLGSYRARLNLGYLLVMLLLASLWTWSLFGPLTDIVIEQQQDHLLSVAQGGAVAVADSDAPPQEVVDRLVRATDLRVTLVAEDGRVVADTHEDARGMENHAGRAEIDAALDGRIGRDMRRSRTRGDEQMYVAVPVVLQGRPAALRVSESLDRIEDLAAQSRRTGLLLLAVAVLAGALVTQRLSALAAAPVRRLTHAAERMAAGDLNSPVGSEAGELGTLSGALGDLRLQMRYRLQQLEAERGDLRAVLDGLADAVFLLEDSTVAVANSAASVLFRVPVAGWRGLPLANTGLTTSLVEVVQRTLADRCPRAEDLDPDPSQRSLRVTVMPLAAAKGRQRTLVVVADVTERARLDGMRRDFVANASHELKTPTAGIQLLAESASVAAKDGDADQALAFVAQIETEASRLRHLVLDLLDLSRLEALPTPDAVTDMREAVELAVIAHGREARRKGLTLEVDASGAAGLDLYARADRTDVAVALDNLLDNAIAYTERGGVTVSLEAGGGWVTASVADTGVGIPADDLPRVFERFYRVDRARTRGGTGLGLALVRHVVERSGGEIALSSRAGEGTTVVLRFPLGA